MTDTISSDPAVRTLPLAADGEVDIFLVSSTLRLRGTDGDRVVVRSHDGRALEGVVAVDGAAGAVHIRDGEAGVFRLGPLVMRPGHSLDLDVEVPRSARLAVRTMSGDVQAVGIGGASRWATASGSLLLGLESGSASIESMSGDVTVDASSALELGVRSVSGRIRVRAPLLTALTASTTSGDVTLDAAFADGPTHVISSVSGDVRLTTGSGVRLETQTVTGDVNAGVPHRAEGGRGHRTLVVGGGGARITVSTLSGDVTLHGPRNAPPPTAQPEPPEPLGATPSAPAPDPAEPIEPAVVIAEAEAAANLLRPDRQGRAPGREPAVAWPVRDAPETARLEILRALERGDLDVDAAARRLEAVDQAGEQPDARWS